MKTTKQQLICRVCRQEPLYDELSETGACADCDFWIEKWQMRNDPRVVRADGNHYFIGPRKGKLGHDGRLFIIKKDGRIIYTNNLWHQGEIPEQFRSILPDNAELL